MPHEENKHRRGIKHLPIICKALGVEHVIISPGSRNAPLIMAFAQSKLFKLYSITDERSAGYFALGLSIEVNKPVVIICTSGTAALNLYPAIAEAYYQNRPLIVITADRPAEFIDQADGQTIRQRNVFANHVKWSAELPVETTLDSDLWLNDRTIAEAISIAIQNPAGPVHINVPLREPLYVKLPDSQPARIIKNIQTENELSKFQIEYITEHWHSATKKLIIAGFNYKKENELNEILSNITRQNSDVIVIAENLSNLTDSNFIFSPERFIASLTEVEKEQFRPDLLITIGNSIISKRLKNYLRKFQPIEHWLITEEIKFIDTFQSLTQNWQIAPIKFFKVIEKISKDNLKNTNNYQPYFLQKDEFIRERHNKVLENLPFSDIVAMHIIHSQLPDDIKLHYSNSMPVRYSQLFSPRTEIQYYCNRGTSGIDGCISTAAGMAAVTDKPVMVITGDLAFIYDSNALWNNYIPSKFKIIVLNNNGGNIFRMIDTSPEIDNILYYFETPHQVNIQSLAEAFGLKYLYADNKNDLQLNMDLLLNNEIPTLLEVKTNSEINTFAYKTYLNQIII